MSDQVEAKRQQLRQLLFRGQRMPWFETGINELITAVQLAASARPEAAQLELERVVESMLSIYGVPFTDRESKRQAIIAWTKQLMARPEAAQSHMCSGCHHRWEGPLTGAELCGDCWRKAQPIVHGAEAAAPPKQPNPCPVCGTYLWGDPRPCWNCARVQTVAGGAIPAPRKLDEVFHQAGVATVEDLLKCLTGLQQRVRFTEDYDSQRHQLAAAESSRLALRADLREQLAQLAHEQWCGWMRYLFGKCDQAPTGNTYIPGEWRDRWTRQLMTSYANLSEAEKESDRKEADRVLALLPPGGELGATPETPEKA